MECQRCKKTLKDIKAGWNSCPHCNLKVFVADSRKKAEEVSENEGEGEKPVNDVQPGSGEDVQEPEVIEDAIE